MSKTFGKCPQCNSSVMLRTPDGQWFKKSNFVQMDLVYEDQSRVRIYICKQCSDSPSILELAEIITSKDSQAGNESLKGYIKSKGSPVGYEIVRT